MSATYLLVEAGGECYAIAVEDVLEVATALAPLPLPGAPPGVIGLQNVRGEIMPILDLASFVGAGTEGSRAAIVVVEQASRRAAFAVDALRNVAPLAVEDEHTEDAPLRFSGLVEGALVGVVDTEAVLNMVEKATTR